MKGEVASLLCHDEGSQMAALSHVSVMPLDFLNNNKPLKPLNGKIKLNGTRNLSRCVPKSVRLARERRQHQSILTNCDVRPTNSETSRTSRHAIGPPCPAEISLSHLELHNTLYGHLYGAKQNPKEYSKELTKNEYYGGLDLIPLAKLESQPLSRLRKVWPRNTHSRSTSFAVESPYEGKKEATRYRVIHETDLSSCLGRKLLRRVPKRLTRMSKILNILKIDDFCDGRKDAWEASTVFPRTLVDKMLTSNGCQLKRIGIHRRDKSYLSKPVRRLVNGHRLNNFKQYKERSTQNVVKSESTTTTREGHRNRTSRVEKLMRKDWKLREESSVVLIEKLDMGKIIFCADCDGQCFLPRPDGKEHECFSRPWVSRHGDLTNDIKNMTQKFDRSEKRS